MLSCAYSVRAMPDNKLLAVVIVQVSIDAGLATGNLVENYLARYYGYSSAFLLATIVQTVDLLYALTLLPPVDESSENAPKTDCSNVWGDFKEHTKETWLHLASFVKKHFLDAKDKTVLLLLAAAFFSRATYGGERALTVLFLKHSPLNLKADEIGIYLTFYESSRVIGLIILAVVINRYLRLSDYTVMFIGTVSMILNYATLSISTTKLMVYLTTILACPASFMLSAVRAQLTKLADKEEQGASLSFVALLASSSVLFMSVGANGLFFATAKVYSGFTIMLMSCSNLMAFIVLCYAVCRNRKRETAKDNYSEFSMNLSDNE